MEARQRVLAEEFVQSAATRGLVLSTTDEALSAILTFLEKFHVSLALDQSLGPQPSGTVDPAELEQSSLLTVAVADFLQSTISKGGSSADVIEETLEGFVLQNTLLLRDISIADRRFKKLRVFCDSNLLFRALGYQGSAEQTATVELISLLHKSGASVEAFESTIREMRRILAVYEGRISTPSGRLSLYPSEMTRYFLTGEFTSSDIHSESALLEKHLRDLDVLVRDLPPHEISLTADEAGLAKRLAEKPGEENVPRVVHDVDCVASILTIRRGRVTDSWDEAGAVFVTTSGLTVRNTCEWYLEQGIGGLPPIMNYLLLSNIAWLKQPASSTKLKLHELVALCVAALRPPRAVWDKFLGHLRKLEASGELSSDEVTAIVASSFTDVVLAEEYPDEDVDSSSVAEVIERVKAKYKEEAGQSEVERLRLEQSLTRRARDLSRGFCWAVFVCLGLSLLYGTISSILSAVTGSAPTVVALVLAVIPLGVVGLLSLLWGFDLNSWRAELEERVASRLQGWLSDGA